MKDSLRSLTAVFSCVVICTALPSESVEILIRASTAEVRAYQIHSKIEGAQAWDDYWQTSIQGFPESEKWQKTAYFILSEPQPLRAYEEVRRDLLESAEWNDGKRAIFAQLLQKLLNIAENSNVRADLCLLQAVQNDRVSPLCTSFWRRPENLRSVTRDNQRELVFGLRLPPHLNPQRPYYFSRISDSQWPIQEWGLLSKIRTQELLPIVSGDCRSWRETKPRPLPSGTSVFFDRTCVKTLRANLTTVSATRKYWENNKGWILPSAVVFALGAIAMKGKTLSISF